MICDFGNFLLAVEVWLFGNFGAILQTLLKHPVFCLQANIVFALARNFKH